MSYDQITAYLRSHNEAMAAGLPAPDISALPTSAAARVTRFLVLADRGLGSHRTVNRPVEAPMPAVGDSIGGDNLARLATFAAGLEAPNTQEGER